MLASALWYHDFLLWIPDIFKDFLSFFQLDLISYLGSISCVQAKNRRTNVTDRKNNAQLSETGKKEKTGRAIGGARSWPDVVNYATVARKQR